MAQYNFLFVFIVYLQISCYSAEEEVFAVDNINLHCRDNEDYLVDWWVIYKPPANTVPHFESGSNFTFITSHSVGRWQASSKLINDESMLQSTLAPLYEKRFRKHVGVMSYGEHRNEVDEDIRREKSTAFGIMFANTASGIWISHTIPGFPNLNLKTALFPEEEYVNGHMIMCLSVNLPTLNAISTVVRHTEPTILKFTLPDNLMLALPEWTLLDTGVRPDEKKTYKTKIFNFSTKEKTLRGVILARSPEDPRCIYYTFAKTRGIVLDVYSNTPYKREPLCEESYSLRYIDSVSLKYPDQEVYYINNNTDKISFGVSTAAKWQRLSQSTPQYWTCIGNVDHQSPNPPKGSLLTCINHYHVWLTFDNLKVKEPEC